VRKWIGQEAEGGRKGWDGGGAGIKGPYANPAGGQPHGAPGPVPQRDAPRDLDLPQHRPAQLSQLGEELQVCTRDAPSGVLGVVDRGVGGGVAVCTPVCQWRRLPVPRVRRPREAAFAAVEAADGAEQRVDAVVEVPVPRDGRCEGREQEGRGEVGGRQADCGSDVVRAGNAGGVGHVFLQHVAGD